MTSKRRGRPRLDPSIVALIAERLKRGDMCKSVADETGVDLSTVYRERRMLIAAGVIKDAA